MSKASAYTETKPFKATSKQSYSSCKNILTKLGRMRLALHRVYWCYENPEAV
jgi:hypothetical protein